MGVFTRFRDIISSNINAMLDKAEDPEKMVRLMIQEMEDTLVEIRASCAGAMATKKKIERQLEQVRSRADQWANRAELAVEKGFRPRSGYAQKCHLCWEVRKFLRPLLPDALGPAEIYEPPAGCAGR